MKRLLWCLISTFVLTITVRAHVVDEYLQSAKIAIARDGVRVELHLTPGVDVADTVLAIIDVNQDGKISPEEEQSYSQRVLANVSLTVDGYQLPLQLTDAEFPTPAVMKEGMGSIQLRLWSKTVLSSDGEHQISFRNDHLLEFSDYLANTLVPTDDQIKIISQQRDELQHGLQVNYRIASARTNGWLVGAAILFGLGGVLLVVQRRKINAVMLSRRVALKATASHRRFGARSQ